MFANFTPNKVLIETEPNEKVQALLFRMFPLILILNSFLNFVLSLNSTYYNTFVKMLIYLLIYNFNIVYYLAPLVVVFVYSNFNFFINSLYLDIYNDSPTINEIIINLNNLHLKFKRLNVLLSIDFNIVNYLLIFSPFYILLIKFKVLDFKMIVLINTIVITNINSSWLISTILLFKRFKFFKNFIMLDNFDYLNDFVIINSLKDNHKIIQFQLRQNQRKLIPFAMDFHDFLFPLERANFTNLHNSGNYSIDKVPFNHNVNFKWLDETWKVEQDWKYYDCFWLNPMDATHPFALTRTRILTKKAILLDKNKDHKY